MEAAFVSADGVRTRILTAGSGGPALLLVHGFGVTADMWVRVIDRLGETFTVVAPDMLGHGFTAWAPSTGQPPERRLAEHVAGVMEGLGHETYAVAGSSLGGIVAAHLYFLRPDRVSALALIGIDAMFTPARTLDPDVVRKAVANGSAAMAHPSRDICERRLRNICHVADAPLADVALVQMTAYAHPDRLTAYRTLADELLHSIASGSAAVEIEKIAVPTLVVCGRQDIRARIDVIQANYRLIPGARLIEMDGCGHLPQLEQPERLAGHLVGFFGPLRPEQRLREDARDD